MHGRHLISMLLIATLIFPLVAGSSLTGGVDKNPDESEVPFSIVERTNPSIDGKDWNIEIKMDDDAYENGTIFVITTQICTNDGVCDPPVPHEGVVEDHNYAISIKPKSDHTYVNWRVNAEYENGDEENFPQGDWFKTWSSCWFNDDAWGGVDSTGDGCKASDESGILPGFALPTILGSIAMAIAYYRRD
jgi:hypothetical protein